MKKQRKRTPVAKRGDQANTLWDQTAEGPRPGVPEAVKLAKRSARMRIGVWACLVLFPFSIIGNLFAAAGSLTETPEEGTSQTADEFAETKSVALRAVTEWLASTPAPLPGGKLVGWDSAVVQEWDPPLDESGRPASGEPDEYRVEAHTVTVTAAGGSLFHANVTVAFDEVNGAVALSTPSLMPYVPANTSWNPNEFPNHEQASLSEAVQTAVANWAAAYTSGDPKLLIQAVRDTDEAHSYLPLTGARLREVVAEAAWKADPLKADDKPTDNEIFVRVTARIDWTSAPVEQVNDAPEISFDLLVEDAKTAAPVVVAWGGPGDGPFLMRHENAITKRVVNSASPLVEPSTSPTPTTPGFETEEPGEQEPVASEPAAPTSQAPAPKKTSQAEPKKTKKAEPKKTSKPAAKKTKKAEPKGPDTTGGQARKKAQEKDKN